MNRAITACLYGDTFATLCVFECSSGDRARAITADLDHEAGDDRQLVNALDVVGRPGKQVRF